MSFRCDDVESSDAAGGILCSYRIGGSTNCAVAILPTRRQ
jgi:hypothetical protein